MTGKSRSIGAAIGLGLMALAIVPAAAGAATWTRANTTPISPIPVNPGPAIPYPSVIPVEDLPGSLTKVTATFVQLRHTDAADIDAVMLGPNGQNVMLMSDTCGNINPIREGFTFDDSAPAALGADPNCPSGTYKPANGAPANDVMPAPSPAAPFGTTMSVFNGVSANGNWNLYVNDDGVITGGDMLGGWRINLTTDASDQCGGVTATILGTDGSDELRGTAGKDVIAGFKGRDEIKGLGGKDVLCGGPGKDTLIGGGGKDKLLGQGGKDKCVGGAAADVAKKCETEKSI